MASLSRSISARLAQRAITSGATRTDILRRFPDLRQTGTKETRIGTLWAAHLSEATLLGELMNRQLENVLHRLGLRLGGSKHDRIDRIVHHMSGADPSPSDSSEASASATDRPAETMPVGAEVLANQNLSRQRASNPQASLQPWLEQLLDGIGQVRCYATEDANPTKQLKNKLSQAAAASGGLLVLMLVDENVFAKAREALTERWMANAEWPKSVACVALAHPLAGPTIEAIIERVESPWASRLFSKLFPSAELISLQGGDHDMSTLPVDARCGRCVSALPAGARFCPHCGNEVAGSPQV